MSYACLKEDICNYCGEEIDGEECGCPPEGYERPGTQTFLYVNAYEVTRHFGGREEGGWWFDNYAPLASIPVWADVVAGHKSACYTCDCANKNEVNPDTGLKYELCRWSSHLIAVDEVQIEMFKAHLRNLFDERKEGDRFSVLGGTDIHICVEDEPASNKPESIPRYE
jgi:hypothetical protein